MLRDYDFSLVDDYYNKIKFLRNNEFIDENNNLLLKGRISCEIKTIDEIFVTEAVLSNVFKHLDPEDIMALISGFINFEINDEFNNLLLNVINTVLNDIKNNNDNEEIKTDILCRNELIKINNNIDKQTCKDFECLLPDKMLQVEIKNLEFNKNFLQENKKEKDDLLGENKTKIQLS
ncbi:Antiviral helicase ski2 [Conglomerata obtusa]